jgi:hypothetical protein
MEVCRQLFADLVERPRLARYSLNGDAHPRVTMSLANGPLEPSEYFPVRFLSRTCGLREGLRFMALVFLVRHANDARVRRADCSGGNSGHGPHAAEATQRPAAFNNVGPPHVDVISAVR